jgi:hypothetical protein
MLTRAFSSEDSGRCTIALVTSDPTRALIADMRASFERLETMVADLHPTDEADPAKAELVPEDLKRELGWLRGGLEQFEGAVDE